MIHSPTILQVEKIDEYLAAIITILSHVKKINKISHNDLIFASSTSVTYIRQFFTQQKKAFKLRTLLSICSAINIDTADLLDKVMHNKAFDFNIKVLPLSSVDPEKISMIRNSLIDKLSFIRQEKKMSLPEIANRLQIQFDQVTRIFYKKGSFRFSTFLQICDILNVDPIQILKNEKPITKHS